MSSSGLPERGSVHAKPGFQDGAALNGSLDGQSGYDTIDFSIYSDARLIALTGYSTDGFAGQDCSIQRAITGSFANISHMIGSSALVDSDTLIGLNVPGTWTINGTNQYSVNPALDFSSLEMIVGGNAPDIFAISGAQNISLIGGGNRFVLAEDATTAGSLNGQNGSATLDYQAHADGIQVNLAGGVMTGAAGGLSSIENVLCGSGDDTVTGNKRNNIISGGDGNNVLDGGAGDDTLYVSGSGLNTVSGGPGFDITYIAYGTRYVIPNNAIEQIIIVMPPQPPLVSPPAPQIAPEGAKPAVVIIAVISGQWVSIKRDIPAISV